MMVKTLGSTAAKKTLKRQKRVKLFCAVCVCDFFVLLTLQISRDVGRGFDLLIDAL